MPQLPVPSWTLRFLAEYRQWMTLPSAVRFRSHMLRRETDRESLNRLIRLRMRRPFAGDVWIRDAGSDHWTFREVILQEVYRSVVASVPDCCGVIDLGGNIGLAARYFAAAYPHCRVLSVEPDSANYQLLERNVAALRRAGRCQTLRAAVWGADGPVAIGPPPMGGGYDAIRVAESPVDGGTMVDGYTVASLIRRSGFPRVDLVKVDIEGAEVELFRGDVSWLDRIRAVAIEFHGESRAQSNFDDVVSRHGFRVDDSHAHTILAVRK